MREIKFRAWDNLKKEMIAEGYHVIGEVTMFGLIDQWVEEHRGEMPSLEYYNHIIESQYTGLKDKNGKEIYEGDILENKTIIAMVWIEDGAMLLGGLNKEWDAYLRADIEEDMEIIGNIYENPDLLV